MKKKRGGEEFITLEDIIPVVDDLVATADGSKWYQPVRTKDDYMAIFKLAL